MNIAMAAAFPLDEFRAFGLAASRFFPKLLSDEDLSDPQARRRHFERSWQAVRYRYRTCAESAEEFKTLLANPSESWRAGWGDEELTYKLERCIYIFFMGGLSVFESFGFCLYFLGAVLRPGDFPYIITPKKITFSATSKSFTVAFPKATIAASLAAVLQRSEFTTIDRFRNLLAHRLSGRRSVRAWSDGTTRTVEETWHIPGSTDTLQFGDDMLHRRLDDISDMLKTLTAAAREFAEGQKPETIKD